MVGTNKSHTWTRERDINNREWQGKRGRDREGMDVCKL